MARPSKFDKEICEEICDKLVDGKSLRAICEADHLPHARTVHRWLIAEGEEYDWFRQQYTLAREMQATTIFDGILEVIHLVMENKLDAKRGRTVIYGLEILASRLNPKKFGRRLDLAADIQTNVGVLAVPITPDNFHEWCALDDASKQLPESPAERAHPDVIDKGGMGVVRA